MRDLGIEPHLGLDKDKDKDKGGGTGIERSKWIWGLLGSLCLSSVAFYGTSQKQRNE